AGRSQRFLVKSGDPRELIPGERAAADSATYFSPLSVTRVIRSFSGDRMARQRVEVLSERERQMLAPLGAGRCNQKIGCELFLVEGTVKSYVSTILNRFYVRNRG
ncbi:MAG: response regulator transcription factor, partial [Pseudonocardia sp.]